MRRSPGRVKRDGAIPQELYYKINIGTGINAEKDNVYDAQPNSHIVRPCPVEERQLEGTQKHNSPYLWYIQLDQLGIPLE